MAHLVDFGFAKETIIRAMIDVQSVDVDKVIKKLTQGINKYKVQNSYKSAKRYTILK